MTKRLFATVTLMVLCIGAAVLLTVSPRATAQNQQQQVSQSQRWQIFPASANLLNNLGGYGTDYPRGFTVLLDTATGETWLFEQEKPGGPLVWNKLRR